MLSLHTAEPLQFLRFDRDPASKPDFTGSTLDEGDTIGVQGLVDRSGTRLSTRYRHTTLVRRLNGGDFVTCTQPLNDSRLHGKFDTIEGQEPNNVLQRSIR
jgi:hypothetical protein